MALLHMFFGMICNTRSLRTRHKFIKIKKQPEKGANAKKFEKFIKITLPISKSIKKRRKPGIPANIQSIKHLKKPRKTGLFMVFDIKKTIKITLSPNPTASPHFYPIDSQRCEHINICHATLSAPRID
jgi:hypothetical protein